MKWPPSTSTRTRPGWGRVLRQSSTRSGSWAIPSSRIPTLPLGMSGRPRVTRRTGIRQLPTDSLMLRGEIRLTDLDPARPGEANKRRPAVIVSNDRANATAARLGRGVVTIVPITSTVTQVFPFQVLLTAEDTGLRV